MSINATGTMFAATVDDVGAAADGFVRGDRVAYPLSLGEYPVISVDTLVGIPRDVSDRQAADLLAPGLVAHAMITRVRPFRRGDRVAVTLGNRMLRTTVAAWVASLGGTIVDDPATADVVYDEKARHLAAIEASHRQGRLQQAATKVFLAIRAGVFDEVAVEHHEAERVAA